MSEEEVLDVKYMPAFERALVDARYIGLHGGRGSAKSHFFSTRMIETNIYEKADNVCLREIQRSLEFSVKKLLESKIAMMNAGYYFEVQDKKILTKQGGVIIFQGMQNHTADSIKSLEGFKYAWFEEAQTASQRSLDILRPTIRMPGSQMWFSWNPENETDPIEFLRTDPPADSVVLEVSYRDNLLLPQILIDEIEYARARDPDKYKHIWLGGYNENSEKRVFKNWVVEEFEAPPDAIFRLGADWGFSVDPSVLIRVHIIGRKLYIDYEAYRVKCEIMDLPELFMAVPDAEKWPMTADSARPETISHMVKNGFPKIRSAIKGPRSIEEGVEWLQTFEIVIHPRCVHTIDEFSLYSYKTDKLTGDVLPLLEDKSNNVIDAVRYACEGARRAKPVVKKSEDAPNPHAHARGWMR